MASSINFSDLDIKWEKNVQVYAPGDSELKEATLSCAIEGIEAAGSILVNTMNDRSTAYNIENGVNSDMIFEIRMFANQARSFSILDRAVGEAKDAHLMALKTLKVPKREEMDACCETFKLLDPSLTNRISEGRKEIEKLEKRVEKLTIAQKDLNDLIPKIRKAWSKHVGQFDTQGSESIWDFFSLSSKPKSENLIFKKNPDFTEVCKLTCGLQRHLVKAKDSSKFGEYLIELGEKLTKLGKDLKSPEEVDEFISLESSLKTDESKKMAEDDAENLKSEVKEKP